MQYSSWNFPNGPDFQYSLPRWSWIKLVEGKCFSSWPWRPLGWWKSSNANGWRNRVARPVYTGEDLYLMIFFCVICWPCQDSSNVLCSDIFEINYKNLAVKAIFQIELGVLCFYLQNLSTLWRNHSAKILGNLPWETCPPRFGTCLNFC